MERSNPERLQFSQSIKLQSISMRAAEDQWYRSHTDEASLEKAKHEQNTRYTIFHPEVRLGQGVPLPEFARGMNDARTETRPVSGRLPETTLTTAGRAGRAEQPLTSSTLRRSETSLAGDPGALSGRTVENVGLFSLGQDDLSSRLTGLHLPAAVEPYFSSDGDPIEMTGSTAPKRRAFEDEQSLSDRATKIARNESETDDSGIPAALRRMDEQTRRNFLASSSLLSSKNRGMTGNSFQLAPTRSDNSLRAGTAGPQPTSGFIDLTQDDEETKQTEPTRPKTPLPKPPSKFFAESAEFQAFKRLPSDEKIRRAGMDSNILHRATRKGLAKMKDFELYSMTPEGRREASESARSQGSTQARALRYTQARAPISTRGSRARRRAAPGSRMVAALAQRAAAETAAIENQRANPGRLEAPTKSKALAEAEAQKGPEAPGRVTEAPGNEEPAGEDSDGDFEYAILEELDNQKKADEAGDDLHSLFGDSDDDDGRKLQMSSAPRSPFLLPSRALKRHVVLTLSSLIHDLDFSELDLILSSKESTVPQSTLFLRF